MKVILRLECIGDNLAWALKHGQSPQKLGKLSARQPWVAELTGIDPERLFIRHFLTGQKDYSEANSVGSRGVYRYFLLQSGNIYEVFARLTWKRSERYYCRINDDQLIRMTQQEVLACLNARSGSMS